MPSLVRKIREINDDDWVGKLFRIYLNEDWGTVMEFEGFIDYALATKKFDKKIQEMKKEN